MADLEDNDDATPTGPGPGPASGSGSTGAGTRVTWRGIIDDETEAARARKHPIRTATARGIDSAMVAVGLRRGRNDDGSLEPRHTRRLAAIAGVIVIVALAFSMLHVIPAGTVLVPVTLGDAQTQQPQGLHITLPWPLTRVTSMSIQIQNYTMAAANIKGTDPPVQVLGSDGASGVVDATVLYRLNPGSATSVFTSLGTGFGNKLVQPTSRACIRSQFANYTMVEAATTAWHSLSDKIASCISGTIEPQGIRLVNFQLRQVVLQSSVQAAINAKVSAQQNEFAQEFQVQTAQKLGDISRINAKAQSDAQIIVACGGTAQTVVQNGQTVQVVTPNPAGVCDAPPLNQNELTYQYIQAIRDLINSKNNVTVVLGTSSNGSPLITLPAGTTGGTPTTTIK